MWRYITKTQEKEFLLSLNLIDVKDENKYLKKLYSISNNINDNYKKYIIKKKDGKTRIVYEPSSTLKHIQRKILSNILENKKISKYAFAYHKNITLKDNAIPHQNKKVILKLDIENFFDNITFYQVYSNCFPIEYFPKSIGQLLTYLVTKNNHLVQGSPTSSYISNLVMKDFDVKIGTWCEENNISYTRYSDDMTFSGNFIPGDVTKKVRNALEFNGFSLNKKKIRIIYSNQRQIVTGIVVNEKIQLSKKYRNNIRQEIYYIKKYGLKSHLEKKSLVFEEKKYLNMLYGKILYCLQINGKDEEFLNYKIYLKDIINKS